MKITIEKNMKIIVSLAIIIALGCANVYGEQCLREELKGRSVFKDPCLKCHSLCADGGTTFHIIAKVFDKENDQPLSNVKVFFVDTGLDAVRSKQSFRQLLGESDSNGTINLSFKYSWGQCINSERELKEKGSFDIKVVKDGYTETNLKNNLAKLPTDVNVKITDVNLKKIILERTPPIKGGDKN